jgi:hypothetical protein
VLGVRHGANCQDGGSLFRFGGPIAVGLAAFAISLNSYLSLTPGSGPADGEARGEAGNAPMTGSIYSKPADLDTATAGSYPRDSFRVRLASFDTAFKDDASTQLSVRSSFDERFAFDRASAPSTLQSAQAPISFDERFNGAALDAGSASGATVRTTTAPSRATGPRASAPSAAARSVVVQAIPKRPQQSGFQLASASDTSLPLGYAPTNSVKSSLKDLAPKDVDPLADLDPSHTAIYDITSHTVYLPNGRRLEAHSGLGSYMDDPQFVDKRMTGPTPPNVYELKMRESLFHGVRAIRLIPKDASKMHGRAGILAHSYLLGPNGESNGCVSFSDYSAFLEAYLSGAVTRLVVVERLADAPGPKTASDWLYNTFKDLFRRS